MHRQYEIGDIAIITAGYPYENKEKGETIDLRPDLIGQIAYVIDDNTKEFNVQKHVDIRVFKTFERINFKPLSELKLLNDEEIQRISTGHVPDEFTA